MKRICLFMSVRMRERASRSATQIKAVDFPLKCSRFTFSSLWKGSGATTPKTTTAPVSQIDTLSFPFQPKSQLLQKSPFLLALSSLAVTSETWINLTGYTEVLWEWLCLHMPLSVQICIVWHTCAHTHTNAEVTQYPGNTTGHRMMKCRGDLLLSSQSDSTCIWSLSALANYSLINTGPLIVCVLL